MQDRIDFFVPGPPKAKGRPRFARRGNFVATYTPKETASYENLIKLAAAKAFTGRQPFDGPVMATILVSFPIPASWSNKKSMAALAGEVMPCKKPDADNVAKTILDACNGIAFADDSQVVDLDVTKRYGITPGVRVWLIPISLAPSAHKNNFV